MRVNDRGARDNDQERERLTGFVRVEHDAELLIRLLGHPREPPGRHHDGFSSDEIGREIKKIFDNKQTALISFRFTRRPLALAC